MDRSKFFTLVNAKFEKDILKLAIINSKINKGRQVIGYESKVSYLEEQITIASKLIAILRDNK